MKTLLAILLLCATAAGSVAADRDVPLSAHPFKTDPNCNRTRPIGEFDPRCDEPTLGFKDFYPPPVIGGSP